jgi:hypothetical protein
LTNAALGGAAGLGAGHYLSGNPYSKLYGALAGALAGGAFTGLGLMPGKLVQGGLQAALYDGDKEKALTERQAPDESAGLE